MFPNRRIEPASYSVVGIWVSVQENLSSVFANNKGTDQPAHQRSLISTIIAPDKDWRQMGIYPPLFDLIGYFKF